MGPFAVGKIESVVPVADELFVLRVGVDASLAASHQRVGQYTWLRRGTQEGAFALAQAPGPSGVWEYLIRESSPLTAQLRAAQPGESLELSAATGPGFPLDKAVGAPLVLVGTGTGIAPLRAVIQQALSASPAHPSIDLIFGVRTARHVPFSEELKAWQARGIGVTLVASEETAATWDGPLGFVHEHVPARTAGAAWAFLCGHPQMVESMRTVLKARGLAADHIALNL